MHWKRTVFNLLLFATAFGYLEAAVVAYLRALHEPARLRFYPARPAAELFPLLTLDQIGQAGRDDMRLLPIEIGREAATLVMLAAVALAAARKSGQWAAGFAIAFGAWDITFYLFLKLLLDWPASLLTWDILFLIPVPWVGPVLAPVLVAAAMVAGGVWHLWRDARGAPVHIGPTAWAGMYLGALVIVVSFTIDFRNIMAGGIPRPFHWGIFTMGLALSAASYLRAALRPPEAEKGL